MTTSIIPDSKERPCHINTLPDEVLSLMIKRFHKKELLHVELVCKKMYELVHASISWKNYLEKRGIAFLPYQVKRQVTAYAQKFCTMFFVQIRGDNAGISGQNVFHAKAMIQKRLPCLRGSFLKLLKNMESLVDEIKRSQLENIPAELELQRCERELLYYLDCDVPVNAAKNFFVKGVVSEQTLIQLLLRMNEVSISEIGFAICLNYSNVLIYLMLQKAQSFESKETAELLRIAIEHRIEKKCIKFLINKTAVKSYHLELAVQIGYPEHLGRLLHEKLIEAFASHKFIDGNFFNIASFSADKAMGETDDTYSEEIVCMILDKMEVVKERCLEDALYRKISDANLKKLVGKADNISSRTMCAAIVAGVSFEIQLLIFHKLSNFENLLVTAMCQSEGILKLLLEKQIEVDEINLHRAIQKKLSENLIKQMLKTVKDINSGMLGYLTNEAKKNGYSEDVIALIISKFSNPPRPCILF